MENLKIDILWGTDHIGPILFLGLSVISWGWSKITPEFNFHSAIYLIETFLWNDADFSKVRLLHLFYLKVKKIEGSHSKRINRLLLISQPPCHIAPQWCVDHRMLRLQQASPLCLTSTTQFNGSLLTFSSGSRAHLLSRAPWLSILMSCILNQSFGVAVKICRQQRRENAFCRICCEKRRRNT